MTRTAEVDGMQLTMPVGWWVWDYDKSDFHTSFQSFAGGSQAMDAVAWEPNGTLWLIEVKDYRRHKRTKPSSVYAEVAGKVRATLAGLAVARVRAMKPAEKMRAHQAMTCARIRVVLQLAQASNPHRLFPQAVDTSDAHIQLRRATKQVDVSPVCAVGSLGAHNRSLPWTTVDL
jgi:hypothetical protein